MRKFGVGVLASFCLFALSAIAGEPASTVNARRSRDINLPQGKTT